MAKRRLSKAEFEKQKKMKEASLEVSSKGPSKQQKIEYLQEQKRKMEEKIANEIMLKKFYEIKESEFTLKKWKKDRGVNRISDEPPIHG